MTDFLAAPDHPLADLSEIVSAIWPSPVTWTVGSASPAGGRLVAELVVMPSARDPRLLLPRGPALAAAACRAVAATHTTRLRARTMIVTSALRLGGSPFLGADLRLWATDPAGARTIADLLGELLGAPVVLSVRLGPRRANRKPVIHALTAAGDVVAVAKLGRTALTQALVRAEADALGRLGRSSIRSVQIPRLVHAGRWGDSELVVQTPLLSRRRRRVPAPARLAAMREVAGAAGLYRATLSDSRFAAALRTRVEAVLRLDQRERLLAGLARLGDDLDRAGRLVPMGGWHGDWTDWNVVHGDGAVLAWDWERSATDVPLGFDALHYAAQRAVCRAGGPTPGDAVDLIGSAPRLLAPFGLSAPEAAAAAVSYLLEIGTRYAADAQAEAGVPAGAIERWLLPALEAGSVAADAAGRPAGTRP